MDITKIKAPLHILCPKCKAELAYNPRTIQEQLNAIKLQYESIIRKQKVECLDKKTRMRYRNSLTGLQSKIRLLQEDKNMIQKMSEELITKALLEKCKREIGHVRFNELKQEAAVEFSEDNCYHTYELAMQKYSNIADNIK